MSPGGRWNGEDKVDWVAGKQELGPQLIISNPSGALLFIHVCYPSSSAVDVNTL